jgi:hypothetical protein
MTEALDGGIADRLRSGPDLTGAPTRALRLSGIRTTVPQT